MPVKKGPESGLPPLVENALSFLEGMARDRVSFLFVEGDIHKACMFCNVGTAFRLQAKSADGEVTVLAICQSCRNGLLEAPIA